MTSLDGKVYGLIKSGRRMTNLLEINICQAMFDVQFYIGTHFKDSLPPNYHIEFYCEEKNMFIVLDENVLKTDYTPFKLNPDRNYGETAHINDCILLFIIEDPPVEDPMKTQLSISNNFLTHNDLIGSLCDKTNFDEFDDILFDPPTTLNTLNGDEIQQNNISFDPENNPNHQHPNMMETSLAAEEAQTIINLIDDLISDEVNGENNTDTDSGRLKFSPDINQVQKHQHLSDQFVIGTGRNRKSGLSLIQGVKTKTQRQKKIQVLPKIEIPRLYRLKKELTLVFFAVYEDKIDQRRIWYKNPHKGFLLPEQLKPNAIFFNPLILNLNQTDWIFDGHYTLKMYLLTQRFKGLETPEQIYQLSESETIQIHSAEHIPRSTKPILITRIMCVPKINNVFDWSALALSNFILPSESKTKCSTIPGDAIASTSYLQIDQSTPSMSLSGITTVQIV